MDLGFIKHFSQKGRDRLLTALLVEQAYEILSWGDTNEHTKEMYRAHIKLIRYCTTDSEFKTLGLKDI